MPVVVVFPLVPATAMPLWRCKSSAKTSARFLMGMFKDEDVPKKLQNDFLHQMYEDFGTTEEDCFYCFGQKKYYEIVGNDEYA